MYYGSLECLCRGFLIGLSPFDWGMLCFVELIGLIVEVFETFLETYSRGLAFASVRLQAGYSASRLIVRCRKLALCVDGSLR